MSMAQSFLTTANRNIKRRIGKLVGKMAIIKPIMDRLRIQETVNNLTNGYGSNHIKVDNGTMGEILIYNLNSRKIITC